MFAGHSLTDTARGNTLNDWCFYYLNLFVYLRLEIHLK